MNLFNRTRLRRNSSALTGYAFANEETRSPGDQNDQTFESCDQIMAMKKR
jgi:hypothetical protein